MAGPSPIPFFEAVSAYQKTEAMRAALALDVFSAIAEHQGVLAKIAARCGASERGIRMLCDYLVINGLLSKTGGRYALVPETAPFLVKTSPAYLGDSLEFLLSPELVEGFRDLAGCVRQGGTTVSARGTMETEHPVWVKFARVMGPVIGRSAPFIAELVDAKAIRPLEVLDIAAGHGLFGIAFAQRNPRTRVTAQDWAPVLEVACDHARQAGIVDRYRLLPGNALEVDLGSGYDVVLLTNFLHHFDVPTCERLLGRVARSLKPGGTAVTLEFVPNEDRVTPPAAATFALTMLTTTAAGDAYTFNEYQSMFRNAGFFRNTLHPIPESPQSVIISVL
jgi:2-polyprenyl-3-methyl-5-hydroxy-6-metoxy-1,4-benzoquinol methylase